MTLIKTTDQARFAVVKKALSQLAYVGGNAVSKKFSIFGKWFAPGSQNVLWCAMFQSWSFAKALGNDTASALLGNQQAGSIGHSFTVSMLADLRAKSCAEATFDTAKAGDLVFTKWRTDDDRNDNIVNHVDMVIADSHRGAITLRVIGGNTPKPGTAGDPTAGRGVWVHERPRSTPIVAIVRPNWRDVVGRSLPGTYGPRILSPVVINHAHGVVPIWKQVIGHPPVGAWNQADSDAMKVLQRRLDAKDDGEPGPRTAEALLLATAPLSGPSTERWVWIWQFVAGVPVGDIDGSFGDQTSQWTRKAVKWAGMRTEDRAGVHTIRACLRLG